MLMTKETVRACLTGALHKDTKLPTKGKVVYVSSVFSGLIGIWWTPEKSPEGKRLYNVGYVRDGGEQPPLFTY